MLFDTDVLIWLFRGNIAAARLVESAEDRRLSVITYMELMQGARDRREAALIKRFLADQVFEMLPLTENIGHRAAIYIEEYALRSKLQVADALIASTAIENRIPLCSANDKHFRAIEEIELKVFRPGV